LQHHDHDHDHEPQHFQRDFQRDRVKSHDQLLHHHQHLLHLHANYDNYNDANSNDYLNLLHN
jgi:hypothetical protein